MRVVQLAASDPAAARALSFGDSETQFGSMREAIDELGNLEEQAANQQGEHADANSQSGLWQQGLVVGLALALCLVLVLAFPSLITRPLQLLLHRIEQIADGDGDLRPRLEVSSRDELGRLSVAFNRFLDKLQPLIREVGRVTGEVADSARQLSGMAAANDQLIGREHLAVDQVSTAATQMSAAVNEVARSAQNAAEAAQRADEQSREGAEVVGSTIGSIRALARDVESASERIRTLEHEAQQIGAVLAVIKGIADQTNLLALNAAIEAARAGEQGRGFAVVADEVRLLAQRTAQSTAEIHTMIEHLQSQSDAAVKAIDTSSEASRQTVEQAREAGASLDAINQALNNLTALNASIASATLQQAHVVEEINRNVLDTAGLSQQTADAARQSSDAGMALGQLSEELEQLLRQFRV